MAKRLIRAAVGFILSITLGCPMILFFEAAIGEHEYIQMLGYALLVLLVAVGTCGGFLAPIPKTCPYCKERIKADATVCRYCGRELG